MHVQDLDEIKHNNGKHFALEILGINIQSKWKYSFNKRVDLQTFTSLTTSITKAANKNSKFYGEAVNKNNILQGIIH